MTTHSFTMPQEVEDDRKLDDDTDIATLIALDYDGIASHYDTVLSGESSAVRDEFKKLARMNCLKFARLHGLLWPQ